MLSLIKNKPSFVNLFVRRLLNLEGFTLKPFHVRFRRWTLSTETRPSSGEKRQRNSKIMYRRTVPNLYFMPRNLSALVFRTKDRGHKESTFWRKR